MRATHQLETPIRQRELGHGNVCTLCGMVYTSTPGLRKPGEADVHQIVDRGPTCKMCRQIADNGVVVKSRKSKPRKLHLVPALPKRPDPYTVAKLLDAKLAQIFDFNPRRILPPFTPPPAIDPDGCEPGWYMSGFDIPNRIGKPLPPETDAQRRKRIAKALPALKRKACGKCPPSTSTTIRPASNNQIWHPPSEANHNSGYWEPFIDEKLPIHVWCPICADRVPLSRWWGHGCKKAVTTTGPGVGDFKKLTDGAAAPEYEEGTGT